jgi:Carbohydrate-binding module family 5/12
VTRNLSEDHPQKQIASSAWDIRQLYRRPAPISSGVAIFEIKVFFDDELVTPFDWKFDIPSDLDEAVLVDCEAWVTTVSTSGTITVQLRNDTQGVDMLSTPLTIDVGERNDDDAGTPFVINTANDDVFYKDEIWVRVVNAGSEAMGLGVKVAFAPALTASIALRGTQGPPGGMSSFQGAWQDATSYQAGDIVTNNGVVYISLQDHTSNAANDEPGVGTNEDDFWVPIIDIPLEANVSYIISSNGPIADGTKGARTVPFDGTIVEGRLLADVSGNAEVDIWKETFAGYPPTLADSITGATPLTLSGAIKQSDSTLSGWTTAVSAGDILVPYVTGVTVIQRLTVELILEKI